LGRHAEAIQDYDLAIDRIGGRERVLCRFARALSLARVGRHERATAEAAALTESKDEPQNVLYSAACVYALSAAKVTGDVKLAEKYAGLAVDLLRRAIQKGYRNAEEMKGQKELDSLRLRADFKKLQTELEKKSLGEHEKR
jgi:hypothetical protein